MSTLNPEFDAVHPTVVMPTAVAQAGKTAGNARSLRSLLASWVAAWFSARPASSSDDVWCAGARGL